MTKSRKQRAPTSPVDLDYVARRFQGATVMVGSLIEPAANFGCIEDIRVACHEGWFTNFRLLAEFLKCPRPGGPNPQMFAPAWTVPSQEWRQRLGKEYRFASTHVAHLWGPDGEPEPPFDADTPAKQRADLKERAEFLLHVIDDFVAAVTSQTCADVMREGVRLARRALQGSG